MEWTAQMQGNIPKDSSQPLSVTVYLMSVSLHAHLFKCFAFVEREKDAVDARVHIPAPANTTQGGFVAAQWDRAEWGRLVSQRGTGEDR